MSNNFKAVFSYYKYRDFDERHRKASGKESMKIAKIVVVALCCLVFAPAKAQIDTQFSQYWALPGYYNPAAAGSTDKLNILTSTGNSG